MVFLIDARKRFFKGTQVATRFLLDDRTRCLLGGLWCE
jgi:hypothetical protein